MKSYRRYVSAAALALVISLHVSPAAFGAQRQDSADVVFAVRDRIVKIIKKFQRVFTVGTNDDMNPPRP